jgi:hypothetical protein
MGKQESDSESGERVRRFHAKGNPDGQSIMALFEFAQGGTR